MNQKDKIFDEGFRSKTGENGTVKEMGNQINQNKATPFCRVYSTFCLDLPVSLKQLQGGKRKWRGKQQSGLEGRGDGVSVYAILHCTTQIFDKFLWDEQLLVFLKLREKIAVLCCLFMWFLLNLNLFSFFNVINIAFHRFTTAEKGPLFPIFSYLPKTPPRVKV